MKVLKKFKHKQRGISTAEVAISSCIMVAIVFVSFDVMVTSAKMSVATVEGSASQSEARTGSDLMIQDIQQAECSLADWSADYAKLHSDNDDLVLLVPQRDDAGQLDPSRKVVIHYSWESMSGSEAPGAIRRRVSTWSAGGSLGLVSDEKVLSNVKKVTFQYLHNLQTSVTPTDLSIVDLPVLVRTGAPNNCQAVITRFYMPSRGIDYELEDGALFSVGGDVRLASGQIELASPAQTTDSISVQYAVDPDYAVSGSDKNGASMIYFDIECEQKSSAEVTAAETVEIARPTTTTYRIVNRATMRNAQ